VVDNRNWGKDGRYRQKSSAEIDPPDWFGQRQFSRMAQAYKFSPWFLRMHLLPTWVFWSLATNGMLAMVILLSLWRQAPATPQQSIAPDSIEAVTVSTKTTSAKTPAPKNSQATQQPISYQRSLDQLQDDANLIAAIKPRHLAVMLGDSISLWFPAQHLPGYRILNQGISGETSAGLLKRLYVFDPTQPEVIFVMIGINDLLRGKSAAEIVENQASVIADLKLSHPKAKIVVQSILPHATEQVTWEGRDRLLSIPNAQIKALNQQLAAIAKQQSVHFLNLYPLFANAQGNLKPELSSDGLHLSAKGYEIWGVALQVYGEEVLR
jgi:lysophospholipase L1-like esterase